MKPNTNKSVLNAEFVTKDHKPDDIEETEYIKKNGGKVVFDDEDDPRVDGYLAMSRAFGDFDCKNIEMNF